MGNPYINTDQLFARIEAWYRTTLGRTVLRAECYEISELLSLDPGHNYVQLLGPQQDYSTDRSVQFRQIDLFMQDRKKNKQGLDQVDLLRLPLGFDSVDTFLIPHVLECIENPGELMNRLSMSLVSGGRVILFGFNPLSLWRLGFCQQNAKLLGQIHWRWSRYVIQSLHKSGLVIEQYKTLFFRPPVGTREQLNCWQFLEVLGSHCLPYNGAVYRIFAKKQRLSGTLMANKLGKSYRWCLGEAGS